MTRWWWLGWLAMLASGCRGKATPGAGVGPGSSASTVSLVASSAASAPGAAAVTRGPLPVRQGSTIARAPDEALLYVADEDHQAVRVLPVPVDASQQQVVAMPGRPAQVLPTSTAVLVTIRDPGLLLVMRREGAGLVEAGRVTLPADAWGVALSPDQKRAVVTSAWAHQVSVVDLERLAVTATIDVAREPRAVLVDNEGTTAWVSHLVGSSLTRIDGVDGEGPRAQPVALAPSPLRAPPGKVLDASLGYSLVASPDGRRLYAPRHALGAQGVRSWYGAPTVDVLELPSQRSPLPRRLAGPSAGRSSGEGKALLAMHGPIVFSEPGPLVQPRAAVYRRKTDTLLIASEGSDRLVELDARSPDPALLVPSFRQVTGGSEPSNVPYGINDRGAAPSGIALSEGEDTAYVFCRASYDVQTISLDKLVIVAQARLADDPLGERFAKGRRMFYSVGDVGTSGGLACAGCHPEGREDGHTWHEVKSPETGQPIFVAEAHAVGVDQAAAGFARQTPILAGRLGAPGPYGWHAQAPTLEARAKEGFALHRWDGAGPQDLDTPTSRMRAQALAPFLREGLVPPPRPDRALTEQEKLGQRIFLSAESGCSGCHDPAQGYTNRAALPLRALPTRAGFVDEEDQAFRTPGLSFLAGTAPYFHDGSVPTLEALIEWNNDRMGKTSHLSKADRAALVAFLKTL